MFDGFFSNRLGGDSQRFLEAFDGFTTPGQRYAGTAEVVDAVEAYGAFGAIASYQVCGCCARFHGAAATGEGGALGVIVNADDRGDFGPNGKDSLSPGDAGTQITRTNMSWASGLGQAATVTYAFRLSAATMPTDTAGFSQFTAAQIAATELALAAWSDVANITFNRVSDAGSQYSNNATILFGNYASGQSGAAAFAYLPGGMPGATGANAVQGDVWINSSLAYNATPVQLGYGQHTLLHEIGHAIGLSHPAAYNASAGQTITYTDHAIYFEDSRQYSVMSYFSESNTGGDFRLNGASHYASAPLMDDIAAAQRLYGANTSTRTGDTTYGFNANAGQPWFSATGAASPLVFCVWDAGGTDTFDFSGYTANGVIDLRQGSFSSVGGMIGNVSIAMGAVIENAIGGSGADQMRGNSGNNVLRGNGGDDVIDGGLGTDTVVFSGNRSAYTIAWNGQVATVTGPDGTDIITNVEFLQFADQTIQATPTGGLVVAGDITNETISGTALGDTIGGLGGDDTINGLGGNDTLVGGSGADTLNGGDGNDVLVGGLGADFLNGGAGIDTADYSGAAGGVTVDLSAGLAGGAAGGDTLTGIENVLGTSEADTLTGDGNANVLNGNGGADTLNGGGGDDHLIAGEPGPSGGAPDVLKGQATANATRATAVSLTGAFDLQENPAILNSTTVPHATVVATTHGGVEYYAITAVSGDTLIFDIDGASFDSTLRLFDASGAEIANNDDDAGDGGNPTDSRLVYNVIEPGTYYIQVAQWAGNTGFGSFVSSAPAAGQGYTLHVSVPSATVQPITTIGSTLNGGAGNDLLESGSGDDALNGGAGTDTAVYTGNRAAYTISTANGVTTIEGPDGKDTLTSVERLQFADGLFDITGAPIGSEINGTSGADTLVGTGGADTINGLAGDDVINGLAGDDILNGGAGDDVIDGGVSGQDVISGGEGNDTVSYASSTSGVQVYLDTNVTWDGVTVDNLSSIENAIGSAHGDYLGGNAGANRLDGGHGDDVLEGGAGDDILIGGLTGLDHLRGGAGNDTVSYAGHGSGVQIYLNDGVSWDGVTMDFLSSIEHAIGSSNADYIVGNAADNRLEGGSGDDVLEGGAGDDILMGGLYGLDHLRGGTGNDTVSYAGHGSGVQIYLDTEVSWDGGTMDFLSSIEHAIGSSHADYIVGNEANNRLEGGAGDDVLEGGAGDDFLHGGAQGLDHLRGGAGVDTVSYAGHGAGVQIYLDTGASWDGTTMDFLSSIENAIGSDHADYIAGNAAANRLEGGAGDDVLDGGAGDDFLDGGVSGLDVIRGGAGSDTVSYASSASGVEIYLDNQVTWDGTTVDLLTSIENAVGSAHADYIAGSNDGNVINGGAGDDQIAGMGGDDTIDGGAGTDVVILRGLQADYTITAEGGGYRIVDSTSGRDGSDLLTGVEILRFSDGSTLDLTAASPQVLPAAPDGKAAGPQVLPGMTDKPGDLGPEVLPAVADKRLMDGLTPETLPGVDSDHGLVAGGRGTVSGLRERFGDQALTLPADPEGADRDAHLDSGWEDALPLVMPTPDDDFVLTGKFAEGPEVLPPAEPGFEPWVMPGVDEAGELAAFIGMLEQENVWHSADHGLTLLDASAPNPPRDHDGW